MIDLKCGDCLELMRGIPDSSVDMILCDLPYGITQNKWDTVIPFAPLWMQYKRITKKNAAIVLFGAMPFTAELVCSNLSDFRYMWIWDKHYCRNFLNAKKQPLKKTENICVFYGKQCTYNPEMRVGPYRNKGGGTAKSECYGRQVKVSARNNLYYPTDILSFSGVPNRELLHPTQKPVPLLEYLIRTYTAKGETVLDNCMGSGSVGVACVNLDRSFIGIELNEKYFQIASKRIKNADSIQRR